MDSEEFHNHLINAQTVTLGDSDMGDHAVALCAEHILHFHSIDYREGLPGAHFIALVDSQGDYQARHWREQKA